MGKIAGDVETMLIDSTWTITVPEIATLPRTYYLELMKQLHEKINLEIGEEKIPSSNFTPLLGNADVSKDFISFYPEQFYQFSLGGLTEYTSQGIAALELGESLSFLGTDFTILNREDTITSYEKLYTDLVACDPETTKYFSLEFLTPTAFSQNRVYLPLPLPNLMFRSWLERWNHFAPIYLGGDELIGYLQNAIALKYHKIQTRFHLLQRGYVVGFTGKVKLQVLHQSDPLLANVANLLLQYARFAGTGVKTRLGMGTTKAQVIN